MTPFDTSYPTSLPEPYLSRFLSKIDKTDGCWLWKSAIARNGYGVFRLAGKTVYAHRLSFAIHRGSPSPLLVIDHLCRTRNCVNPDHLRELDRGENVSIGRSVLRERTHCANGHEFTDFNTRRESGRRVCRVCHNERNRKFRAKQGTAINEVLEVLGASTHSQGEQWAKS
jgi:hypothetical protein